MSLSPGELGEASFGLSGEGVDTVGYDTIHALLMGANKEVRIKFRRAGLLNPTFLMNLRALLESRDNGVAFCPLSISLKFEESLAQSGTHRQNEE